MGSVISFSGKAAAFSMRKALAEGLNGCLWQSGSVLAEKNAAMTMGYCMAAIAALNSIGDKQTVFLFENAMAETRDDWRNFEHVMRNLHARLIDFPVEAPASMDAD